MQKYSPVNTTAISLAVVFSVLCFSASAQRYMSTDSLLKVYNSNAHDSSKVSAAVDLGWQIVQNDPSKGQAYALTGLKMATRLKDTFWIADANRLLGYYYFCNNDFSKAAEYYLIAIKLFEKKKKKLAMSRAYNNMGALYEQQRMYEDAIRCYKKSLELKAGKSDKWQSAVLSNIGNIYGHMEKYDLAEEYINKALAIEKKYGFMNDAAGSMQSLAIIASETNRTELAVKLYNRALFIYDSVGNIANKRTCLLSFANYYYDAGNYKKALKTLHEARAMAKAPVPLNELELHYSYCSMVERALGNYKNAMYYSDSLITVMEKLYSADLSLQTKELLKKYESEKVEKENAILKEEKLLAETAASRRRVIYVSVIGLIIALSVFIVLYMRQKKIRQEQKSIELEQKVLRAQMNPHFIFNALNAIQKLYLEKKQEQADDYMGDFGNLLRKILDNSGRSLVSLHEEITTIRLYLNLEKNRLEDAMEYELTEDENLDMHHTLVPPLILQPIIENAIWHGIAPKGSGKIKITCRIGENNLLLFTIEDNGVGIVSAGDQQKNHESKGMLLTQERLKPNGWIKIEPASAYGTIVTIAVPYKTG